MISHRRGRYLFIRLFISYFQCIAPLSLFYCILKATGLIKGLSLAVDIYAVAEAAFYLFVFLPRRYALQRPANHPPTPNRAKRRQLFKKCQSCVTNPEQYWALWFKGVAFEQIGRDNVKDWLAWGFLNKATWEAIDDDELEEYIVESEILLGRKFLLGRKAAMPMKPILDPVQISHRPLLYYLLGVGGSDVLSHLYLLCHTFEYYSPSTYFTSFPFRPLSIVHNNVAPSSHLSYYHRPHTSRSHLPVLFIHGVGILNVYQNLLTELNRASDEYVTDGDIGVIVLEIKSIRFCITRAALSKDEMCAEILTILQMHNWDKFVLMGNSYGTVISAQLLKNADIGPRMGAILFIDPIPFLMHLPELVYNFIYRPHRKASEHQLHYFASTDMGTAHTLMRRMFWSESILWKEDIEGRKITIILSEKDIIVDAEAVGRYLTRARGVRAMDDHRSDQWKRWAWKGEGMDVLWFKGLNHAEVFDTKADRETLIRVLMDYCKRGD